HPISLPAVTSGRRRAKAPSVPRAADLEGDAATPVTLVPAVVRDSLGYFIDGLSVGDFVLLENGARQPIVHFDDTPVPQSVAVAIQSGSGDDARRAFQPRPPVLTDS